MIKVVQIVEDLKIGGLERIIENVVTSINPEIFRVYVLCLSRGGSIADRLIANHKEVEILNIKNYHNPLNLIKVAKWLRRKKIDIVHTHGYPAGVLGRVAAILSRVPCIFHHVHSTYLDLNRRNHLIELFLSKFTCNVICCSEAVRRFVLEKEGISENKLMVLYNGTPEPNLMNISAIDSLKKGLGIPQDVSVIGCVASLVQHKGHEYLLDAFKKVQNAYLLLIGDGPLRTKLEQRALKLGISERVVFAGYKIDVTPYLQITDTVVLPSCEREGFGMALIEAMALSKPVVATNIGGVREVVEDSRTGFLVRPKDTDVLADAIKRLLNSSGLMQEMGLNGRDRYLRMFTLDEMIQKIEELYGGNR